ncbi:16903_t:CDS:2 [Funneliformis geosporum]|uniref:7030_t:CDS:1 n=1 Tax=Funneliformis geosporum TaxID=1117311 RepID=A0A9W4T1E8_9GLOM|nr:16903_t:CDS:2 [Funneliformis geosporum]CAI2186931.1 7030_t:CDS:2 [Funneliformis geosporum]
MTFPTRPKTIISSGLLTYKTLIVNPKGNNSIEEHTAHDAREEDGIDSRMFQECIQGGCI